MKAAGCMAADCMESPKGQDVFCAEHWKVLPRQARTEIVVLRNAAMRGNKAAARDFMRACAVAAHLIGGVSLPASTRPSDS